MHRRISIIVSLAMLAVVASAGTALAGSKDRDHDGMPDRWERRHGLSFQKKNGGGDPDHDGLTNRQEFRIDRLSGFESDPKDRDTDSDGVEDGNEDQDHDGLDTEDEVGEGTRFNDPDSDNDGTEDGDEDRDGDGLDDGFEQGAVDEDADHDHDGRPDGRDDDDHDGTHNDDEFSPDNPDSDHDEIVDGEEDEDGDGRHNDEEQEVGDDPTDDDSDHDGVEDGEELSGRIVSFNGDTGLLTVGHEEHQISGMVGEETELRFTRSGGDGPCAGLEPTTEDLVPGQVVHEAGFFEEQGPPDGFLSVVVLVCPESEDEPGDEEEMDFEGPIRSFNHDSGLLTVGNEEHHTSGRVTEETQLVFTKSGEDGPCAALEPTTEDLAPGEVVHEAGFFEEQEPPEGMLSVVVLVCPVD